MLKNKNRLKQMIILITIIVFILGVLTLGGDRADKNGSRISDDGRSYGGIIKAEVGDKIETAFFDVTVENAVKYDTYQFDDGLYQAEEGKTYLVVTLTIKNTYDEDIPMSITDFILDYEGNKSKEIITGYGKVDLNQDNFMDNLFTLKQDESVTKSILFTVQDMKQYTLNYTEFYEDEFKGDSFEIAFEPETISSTEVTTQTSGEATTQTPVESATQATTEAATQVATEATTQEPTEVPTQTSESIPSAE